MTTDQLKRAEEIATMFENVLISSWSLMWPNGHCAVSSLMLAPVLRPSLEVDLRIVIGRVLGSRIHAWIESPEGDVIDPTFGQFDENSERSLHVVPAHHATAYQGEVKLTLDQEEHYRRSIKPYSYKGGWGAGSGIKKLFNEYPIPVEV